MIDLKNKTVLITGASRGVGAAAAESCMKAGARVLMHYGRDRKAAEAVAEKIGAKKSDLIEADLNVPEHPAAVWAAALDRAHRIDVLVNNVGGTIWMKPFHLYSDEEIELELERSLKPTLWCCRAVLPTMMAAPTRTTAPIY